MPRPLTPAERERFFGQWHVAVLATLDSNGRPLLTPVWYLYRDGLFYMRTGQESVKAHNIRRDPRVVLCIQDERAPYKSVTVYGRASLEAAQPGLDAAMARRYLGAIGGYFYRRTARRTIEASAEVTLLLRPERIVSLDYRADTPALGRLWLWARRLLPPWL